MQNATRKRQLLPTNTKIRGPIFISHQLKPRLTFFTLADACHDLASDSKVSNGIRDTTKKQVQNKVQLLLKIVLLQRRAFFRAAYELLN